MPGLHALFDPTCKVRADETIDDIADVLPRHLHYLFAIGQCLSNGIILKAEVDDLLQREVLIVGHVYHFDIITF
jgi:hypothetical protein